MFSHHSPNDDHDEHDQLDLLVRAGTPFLLGPEGAETLAGDDEDPRAETQLTAESDGEVPISTAESTKHGSKTHTSTSAEATSSETTTSISSTITSTIPTITSTSTEIPMSSTTTLGSAVQVGTVDDDPPAVQLSSIAYLVPVFLFLFITIAALIYRKYRARKRIDRESSSTFRSPLPHEKSQGKGWKEVKGEDDDDKEGIWNDDSDKEEEMDLDRQWRDIYVKESKSRPGLLDVSTAGGWLRSSAWKSARSINDQAEGVHREKTVKLVTRSIPTYQSLLPGQTPINPSPTPSTGDRFGSLRAFKDSFNSITLHPIVRQLERNKSPNKRRIVHPPPPPPEEPAWIRPRAASPVNLLSPPSQPHFFFQPTPPQSMVMHRAQVSESDYSVTETDSESLLSNVHQRHVGFTESNTRADRAGKPHPSGSVVDLDRTPTKSSMATIKPVSVPGPSVSKTPTGIRRSSAVRDLALAKTPSKRQKQRDTLSPNVRLTPSARKHKKQMKDDKARQRVESILQASWSDRALSSPSASMDSLTCPPGDRNQVPGWASPGVEQVGGIQARLAMIRSMENK
jgi:hypothetical protein